MLAYLKGIIQSKEMTAGQADRLVLDVSGVGFELNVSRRTLADFGEPGDQITVYTSLVVRENEWTIYGFSSNDERQLFMLLQSVTGIGPKLAVALVGTLSPGELVEAILSENHKLISQAPGVGAKVAQRIILELKGKVQDLELEAGGGRERAPAWGEACEEVRSILEGLGYTTTEVNMALRRAKEDKLDDDVETLVRHSLKVLGAASVPA